MTNDPIIKIEQLEKSFGDLHVLKGINLEVDRGEVVCIIGASGSGKSTLLRCINLLETPTNGKVLFHGSDITATGSDPCAYRAKVGMVFQSFNLFNNMTVLDNCTAGLRYVLYVFVTDLQDPAKLIAEPGGFFIAPLGKERVGDVSNVVFTNGAIADDDGKVYVYYASSDTRMHVAETSIAQLLDYAFGTPADPLRSADCVRQRCALIEKNLEYMKAHK